jgi:hypothetical protein
VLEGERPAEPVFRLWIQSHRRIVATAADGGKARRFVVPRSRKPRPAVALVSAVPRMMPR